jgi:hypothetical protein
MDKRVQLDAKPAPAIARLRRRFDGLAWVSRKLGLSPAPNGEPTIVQNLQRALRGGLSSYAAPALAAIIADAGAASPARAAAAIALAAWRFEQGDPSGALAAIRAAPSMGEERGAHAAIVETEALLLLGRREQADEALRRVLAFGGERPAWWFARANCAVIESSAAGAQRSQEWLSAFNRSLLAVGLSPLRLRDASGQIAIGNLAAISAGDEPARDAKISILMPVYNAASTLSCAIGSLLGQTWRDVEIVAVDDCSADGSWALLSSIAAVDQRVVPIRHDQNRGAYPAMNTALRHATGAFVTTHGADDWSHPEKLSRQLAPIRQGVGDCTISWAVRVADGGRIELRARTASHLFPNVSSTLFRRSELETLGGWDEVRADADAEIYARYRARFGKERLDVLADAPLSLISARPDSLTKSRTIGLQSIGYGARREYRESYAYWHRLEAARTAPDFRCGSGRRPFPVPRPLLGGAKAAEAVDVLFVSDFSAGGSLGNLNLGLWRQADALRLTFAFLHWPRPQSAGRSLHGTIRAAVHERAIECLVAGDSRTCRLAVVTCAAALEYLPDLMPNIAAKSLIVRVDRHLHLGTLLERAGEHARRVFGAAPTFAPASPWLRLLLRTRCRGVALTPEDWNAAFPPLARHGKGVLAALAGRTTAQR